MIFHVEPVSQDAPVPPFHMAVREFAFSLYTVPRRTKRLRAEGSRSVVCGRLESQRKEAELWTGVNPGEGWGKSEPLDVVEQQ